MVKQESDSSPDFSGAPEPGSSNEQESSSSWCPLTSWTRIHQIHRDDEENQESIALNELCRRYREPLLVALRYKHGFSKEDAEDVIQEFFSWFLRGRFILRADKDKGKFRTFILTYLDNFARNQRRKLFREKGGNVTHLPIDESPHSSPHGGVQLRAKDDPIHNINVEWARATLEAAREALHLEEQESGRTQEWEVIQNFLSTNGEFTMQSAAAALGVSKENIKVKVHRLRKQYHFHLSEQVSATVSNRTEYEEEMSLLREVFS